MEPLKGHGDGKKYVRKQLHLNAFAFTVKTYRMLSQKYCFPQETLDSLKKSIETLFFHQTSHIIAITKVLLANKKVLRANTNVLEYNISIDI